MKKKVIAPVPDKKKKALMLGLGIAAAGAISYFGWQYWKKRKASSEDVMMDDNIPDIPATPTPRKKTVSPAPSRNDNFPLKKGSKGANVKTLQEALIAKYGKSILPKYGADGDFGTELVAALKKAGLPEQVNQSTLNVLNPGSGGGASFDPKKAAMDIYQAASRKDFKKTLDVLKTLKSTDDYKQVGETFKNYRIGGGVRQTLVSGLLNTFTQAAQKDQLRMEFLRMGLNYDGSQWSLSGIDSPALITTKQTVVWKDKKTPIKVPENMVLGREVSRKIGYILFENDGRNFLVEAAAVKQF